MGGATDAVNGSRRGSLGSFAVLALVYGAVFAVWVVLHPGSPHQREVISDLAPLPAGLAAAVTAWLAGRRSGLDPATSRAWLRIAAAFLLWWVGDVVWFTEEVLFDRAPFPSPADVAYLAFYPFMAWGLLSFPSAPRTKAERTRLAVTVLLVGGMAVWYLVVGPAVQGSPADLATTLSVAYPVGDLVLLFGVVLVLLRRQERDAALWLLPAGVGSFLVADLSYARLSLSHSYQGGDWPDAFWIAAQCLFAVAGYACLRGRPAGPEVEGEAHAGSVSRLPYVAVALGYGLLLAVGSGQAESPLNGLLVGAVGVTGLVMIRQIHLSAENARLLRELADLAQTDSLTSILNRRRFLEVGERLLRRGQYLERPLSVLMIDVDHFKAINDAYGHAAGDQVLVAVAAHVKAQLRDTDIVGRYGGDEVAVVMPDCSFDQAFDIADRIQQAVADRPVMTDDGMASVTLSIGVSEAGAGDDLAKVLGYADAGLYEAKRAGRGCTRAVQLQA